jgi:hypothetical protein
MSAADLEAIRRRALRGPTRADVSEVLAAYRQSRADVLRLLGELEEPRQEKLV